MANDAHCDNHCGFVVSHPPIPDTLFSKLAQGSFQATIFEQILHHLVTRDGRRFVASPEAHEYRAPMYFGMLVASMRPAPPRL